MNRRQFLSVGASLAGLSLTGSKCIEALAAPLAQNPSPFANTLVFAQGQTLVFMSPDGKTVREVPVALPEKALIQSVSASKDGKKVAFSAQNVIYTVKSDGSDLCVLGPKDEGERSHPALSPDGTLVACGHNYIHHPLVVLAEDGQERSLGDSTLEATFVRFTRDGTSLIFNSQSSLFQIPLAGGVAKRISRGTYIEQFDTGPDGRIVASIPYDTDAVQIHLLDPAEDNWQRNGLKLEGDAFFSPTWSPNGKFIAYTHRGRYGIAYSLGVFIVNLSDLKVTQISDRHLNANSGLTWR